MIKCKRILRRTSAPPSVYETRAHLDIYIPLAKSQTSLLSVTIVMSVIMKLLLWKPKGLDNLPLWTPSLTLPFSVYHAPQQPYVATEKKRLRDREAYRRNKERFENREATQQPADFYWPTSRWSNDPTWRAKRLEWQKAYDAIRNQNEALKMRQILKNWVIRYSWLREDMPWQSHRPVLYDERTEHYCVGCKWTRPGGRRVYWQSLVNTTEYLCTRCYIPSKDPDWNKIMPEGYEDVRDMKAMRARKEQLDASKVPSS